jgi:DNA-directed RNA polymerase subunit RPC12/RpoP
MQVNCLICGSIVNHAFSALILNKYEVEYYRCPNCSFMFTENPYWLNESYKEPINKSDTGILQRNIDLANKQGGIILSI